MLSKLDYFKTLAAIATIASCRTPAAAVCALAIVFAASLAEKYFHSTFYDKHSVEIAQLKADYSKLKTKQDAVELKTAFTRNG